MWKTKVKLKHDCLFGNNCQDAQVSCSAISFNYFKKGSFNYVYHFGTVFGENYKKFFRLLRKDSRIDYIEIEGKTFLIVEKRKEKNVPGMFITQEIIYTRPVLIDTGGYETWELAAINKKTIMDFINRFKDIEVFYINQTTLKDVYFPRLSPNLTDHQRAALELAIEFGFYEFPKKTDLDKLARKSKLSKSGFREHLKRAESKVLGKLFH
jgi:predicted DNA binding protein